MLLRRFNLSCFGTRPVSGFHAKCSWIDRAFQTFAFTWTSNR